VYPFRYEKPNIGICTCWHSALAMLTPVEFETQHLQPMLA
jgi:hypothetical protein